MTAKKAIKRIQGGLDEGYHKINKQTTDWPGDKEALEFAIQCMNAIRPQGVWVFDKTVHPEYNPMDENEYHCCICGRLIRTSVLDPVQLYPYCHCGAEMKKEKRNETK